MPVICVISGDFTGFERGRHEQKLIFDASTYVLMVSDDHDREKRQEVVRRCSFLYGIMPKFQLYSVSSICTQVAVSFGCWLGDLPVAPPLRF